MIIHGASVDDAVTLLSNGETIDDSITCTEALLANERQDAYQKGKTDGEQIGYEKAHHEVAAYFELLQRIIEKILEQKHNLCERLKPELIEFSLTVCERVIRQELSQPEKLAKMIDSLLAGAAVSLQGDLVKIVLAPDDLVLLEKHLNKIQYDKREIKALRFVSDPLMRRGDCRIETKAGLLNCSISRELEDLRTKVLQR